MINLDQILKEAIRSNASDIHLVIISFSLSVNSLLIAHFGQIFLTNLCDIDVANVLE